MEDRITVGYPSRLTTFSITASIAILLRQQSANAKPWASLKSRSAGERGTLTSGAPIFSGSHTSPQPALRQHMNGGKSRQWRTLKCWPEMPEIQESKNRNPMAETAPSPVPESAPQMPDFMVRKPSLQPWFGNHHYYLYLQWMSQ